MGRVKLKLTPEMSYLIGMFNQAGIEKGVGVKGKEEVIEVFIEKSLKLKLTEPNKLILGGNKAYFYNSKLRKFFEKVLEEVEDRFIFANDYASNYFAGMFDVNGEIKENNIIAGRFRLKDSLALQKLGFPNKNKRGRLIIEGRKLEFLRLILPSLTIKKQEVEHYLKAVSEIGKRKLGRTID